MDKPSWPEVSVLICTRNRSAVLRRCLESVLLQHYPKEKLEIIVYDDASEDDTRECVECFFSEKVHDRLRRTRLLQGSSKMNISYGRKLLGGEADSRSEFLLFCDDDAVLDSECLCTLVSFLQSSPGVGIAGPRILQLSSPGTTAHMASFVGSWTGLYRHRDSAVPISCHWLNSTCMLVRHSAYRAANGFWEGYYISHQEVDFCLRIGRSGYDIFFVPEAKAYHDIPLGTLKRERLFYVYRNKIILIRRNFHGLRKVFALALVLIFGIPKYIWESVNYHSRFVPKEIGLILQAVVDGFLGRTGPRETHHA